MDFFETPVIGESLLFRRELDLLRRLARCNKNVLIQGETGTGKSLIARKLHQWGDKKNESFVTLNCSNIPEALFEAELFGYVKGAFTGAIRDKLGLLEVARNGAVFLDEIDCLPLHLQAKLLRTIEEKELRRIGDIASRKIHARYIFATNKDLIEEIKQGKFREDLYFRISVVKLNLPPLKERKEDIVLLVKHVLEKENRKRQIKKDISERALKKLLAYDFPGNVRELENVIERACLFSKGILLTEKDIRFDYNMHERNQNSEMTPQELRRILENCRWNKTRAAMEVGKSRRQFYRLLNKYRMEDCFRKSN